MFRFISFPTVWNDIQMYLVGWNNILWYGWAFSGDMVSKGIRGLRRSTIVHKHKSNERWRRRRRARHHEIQLPYEHCLVCALFFFSSHSVPSSSRIAQFLQISHPRTILILQLLGGAKLLIPLGSGIHSDFLDFHFYAISSLIKFWAVVLWHPVMCVWAITLVI